VSVNIQASTGYSFRYSFRIIVVLPTEHADAVERTIVSPTVPVCSQVIDGLSVRSQALLLVTYDDSSLEHLRKALLDLESANLGNSIAVASVRSAHACDGRVWVCTKFGVVIIRRFRGLPLGRRAALAEAMEAFHPGQHASGQRRRR